MSRLVRANVVLRLREGSGARGPLGFADVLHGLGALVGGHPQLDWVEKGVWGGERGRGCFEDVRGNADGVSRWGVLLIRCMNEVYFHIVHVEMVY